MKILKMSLKTSWFGLWFATLADFLKTQNFKFWILIIPACLDMLSCLSLVFIFLLETATYLCSKNGKILPVAIICAYCTFWSALYIVLNEAGKVVLRKTLVFKLKSLYCKIYWYALKETQSKNPHVWWNSLLCCHSVHSWELGLGGSGSFIRWRFLELRWK